MQRSSLAQAVTAAFLGGALFASGQTFGQEELGRKPREKIKIVWGQTHTSKHYQIHWEQSVGSGPVSKVSKALEEVLVQFTKVFGYKHKGDPFKVRFMDSLNTYEQVGGDPAMAGFFNPASGFLVIKQMPYYQLLPTVYHEAFHQYLQAYVDGGDGPVGIPMWFNEGLATYFEGMQTNKRTKKLDFRMIDNRKIRMIQQKILTRQHLPLPDLLDAPREKFYGADDKSLYYNQSMALVYFMMQGMGGKPVHAYAKELKKTKDPEQALVKILGKERKKLKSFEKKFKAYTRALKLHDGTGVR